jgi:hypothetical protein
MLLSLALRLGWKSPRPFIWHRRAARWLRRISKAFYWIAERSVWIGGVTARASDREFLRAQASDPKRGERP